MNSLNSSLFKPLGLFDDFIYDSYAWMDEKLKFIAYISVFLLHHSIKSLIYQKLKNITFSLFK